MTERGESAVGHAVGARPVREHGTVSRGDGAELGLVGPAARACGLERDVRHEFPVRHLPLLPDSRFHVAHRRRVCAGVRALAGDPAVDGVHLTTAEGAARQADARARSEPLAAERAGGVAGRRLARRDLSRGDADGRPFRATRSSIRRSTTGWDWRWHARPADLRFPALQQEFQPVLLRP